MEVGLTRWILLSRESSPALPHLSQLLLLCHLFGSILWWHLLQVGLRYCLVLGFLGFLEYLYSGRPLHKGWCLPSCLFLRRIHYIFHDYFLHSICRHLHCQSLEPIPLKQSLPHYDGSVLSNCNSSCRWALLGFSRNVTEIPILH